MRNILVFVLSVLFQFIEDCNAQRINIPVERNRELWMQQVDLYDSVSLPYSVLNGDKLISYKGGFGLNFYSTQQSTDTVGFCFSFRPLAEIQCGKIDSRDDLKYTVSTGLESVIRYRKCIFQAGIQIANSSLNQKLWNDSLEIVEHYPKIWFYQNNYPVYVSSYGLINYTPWSFLNLEAGYGKHFWGDGYRSLFLSDEASPYPYGKAEARFWKINYTQLYSFLRDVDYPDYTKWKLKYASSHLLKLALFKKLSFYAFESVVWSQTDSIVYRGFDVQYLNPVVFFRPVEYQLSDPSPDNVLLGIGFEARPLSNLQFYGQMLLDEFNFAEIKARNGWWANKYAIQLGFKYFQFANVKNWIIRTELNLARPYTWSHEHSTKNYGNQGQALAHPLGANFLELLLQSNYYGTKYNFFMTISAYQTGTDSSRISYGQNIYKPYIWRADEYDQHMFQGSKLRVLSCETTLWRLLIKKWDIHASLSAGFQYVNSVNDYQFRWQLRAGIKSILFNW